MATLKLYGMALSTCTARAMICMNEKQVEFEFVPVNLLAAHQKQPSFLSKNPFGEIPVLEDEDLTLFESRAITRYISEKYKSQGIDLLRHGDHKESAIVTVWLEVESHQYNPAIQPIIYQFFINPLLGKPTDQSIVAAHVEKLGKVLDIYDQKLGSTKYLAGDYYTLADLHHIPYTHYLMKSPFAYLIESRPNVKAWWVNISTRPSFVQVAQNMEYPSK